MRLARRVRSRPRGAGAISGACGGEATARESVENARELPLADDRQGRYFRFDSPEPVTA